MDGGHEAVALGRGGIVRRAGQQHRLGPRHADEARQSPGGRHEADIDAGADEARAGGGDPDVAGERDLEPAADAPAIDRGDDGQAEPFDPLEQLAETRQVGLGRGGVMRLRRSDPLLLEIVATAEGTAAAGHDDRAGGAVGLDRLEMGQELGAHRAAHRVHRRIVELEERHMVAMALQMDRGTTHRSALSWMMTREPASALARNAIKSSSASPTQPSVGA